MKFLHPVIVVATFLYAVACMAVANADPVTPNNTRISVSNTNVILKQGPGIFWGGFSTANQSTPLACWDSATGRNGNQIFNVTLLSSFMGYGHPGVPPYGINFTIGLTCWVPGTISGSLGVLWS